MTNLFSAVITALVGCGGGGNSNLAPTTYSPINAVNSASQITLDCNTGKFFYSGDTAVENNIWGAKRASFSDYFQCVGIGTLPDGSTAARWKWDWKNEGGTGVKAYPEIIYGWKPGTKRTNTDLPIRVGDIKEMKLEVDIISSGTGQYNTLIDVWVTNTKNPTVWGSPPLTREIMIWKGNYLRCNQLCGTGVVLGGKHWRMSHTDVPGSWQRVYFYDEEDAGNVYNIKDFLDYMKQSGQLSDDEYISSIEIGNEIWDGAGETTVNKFKVTVK
jgi:hypothetical protein